MSDQEQSQGLVRRLTELGFDSAASLRGQDLEDLFARTKAVRGTPEDPCLLDTYRAIIALQALESRRCLDPPESPRIDREPRSTPGALRSGMYKSCPGSALTQRAPRLLSTFLNACGP
jgi:hypothetical protein